MSDKAPCSQCQAWMEDAFSDELEAGLRPKLEAHLQDCAECRAVWADYQTLRRGMQVLAETEGPSLRVQNQILRTAEARAERRSAKRVGLWSWLLRPATVAFATLALIAGIGLLGRQELQRRKASEHMAPAIAPQGTPEQESAGEAPLAPPPPPAVKRKSVPLDEAKPTAPATKPEAAPVKQDLAAPAKAGDESPRTKDQAPAADAARQPSAPPPAPATTGTQETAPAQTAPMKSLAKPAPGVGVQPAPEPSAPSTLQTPTIPEVQSGFGGGTVQGGGAAKGVDKEEKREKSAPLTEVEADAQPAAGKKLEGERPAEQAKEKEGVDRFSILLNAAKAKIRQNNYTGALEDLLAAQRIRDTKEIQDLILLCRSHLRGDG